MVTFKISQSVMEFAKSRVIRATLGSMVYLPTCPRAQFLIFMYRRTNGQKLWKLFNLAFQWAKACQFFNFVCQNSYQFFNYFSNEFFNLWIFLIMLNISKFQEYLSNFRKLISSIITRNGKIVWKHGRLHRKLFGILKFTKRHETPGITFKNHGKLWRGLAPFRSFSCYFG